jgi:protein TonB
MANTLIDKVIRLGVMIAVIAGSAAACHYKADEQYVSNDDIPGADSGTRRVSTTTMRSDSTSIPMDSTAMKPADTAAMKSSGASKKTSMTMPAEAAGPAAPPAGTSGPADRLAAASARSVNKVKIAHGRTSVAAPTIYTRAEIAPVFPGGQRALDNYITHTVKYPQQAIDDDVSGTVHVSFVVDEQGHVTKARVLDRANLGDGLDQEALRVVKNMPAWTPGMVKGKKVKTRMELPINFQVES